MTKNDFQITGFRSNFKELNHILYYSRIIHYLFQHYNMQPQKCSQNRTTLRVNNGEQDEAVATIEWLKGK